MGTFYIFKCNKCDYWVESCGNLDYGMMAVLRPYICNDCKIVTDALVGFQGMEYKQEWLENPPEREIPEIMELEKDEYYRCQECEGKNLTLWNTKWRKCPKCSSRMLRDSSDDIVCWD